MVVTATVVTLALRPLKIPDIVSWLLGGLLLGPVFGVLAWVHGDGSDASLQQVADSVHLIAELGVTLLLFLVGMELSLPRIMEVGKVAVAAGLGQVVFTAAGGYVIASALGFEPMAALFLATALTFSSTVVVVKLVDQLGDMQVLYARIAVGIFLVQDMVVIVVLTVLAGMGEGESAFRWQDLAQAFGGMALLLGVAVLASRWVLPVPVRWASRSPQLLMVGALAWCMLFVETAHVLKLSPEIGAFLAGISLAQLHEAHDLRRRIHPLMSFFTAVFFVALGAEMDLSAGWSQLPAAAVLSLFVLLGNPLIFILIIAHFGYGERTVFRTSVTVAQISEFSFIFSAAGVQTGLIDRSILSLVGVVGLVTIIVSAWMILYSDALYRWCRDRGLLRVFRIHQGQDPEPPPARTGHAVVVGANGFGRRAARLLADAGLEVLLVDRDPARLVDLPWEVLQGDIEHAAVQADANLREAKVVVNALREGDAGALLAHLCQQLGVPLITHVSDAETARRLAPLEPALVLVSRRIGRADMLREVTARLDPQEQPC